MAHPALKDMVLLGLRQLILPDELLVDLLDDLVVAHDIVEDDLDEAELLLEGGEDVGPAEPLLLVPDHEAEQLHDAVEDYDARVQRFARH